MGNKGFPLSPGFWRQLDQEGKAQEMEGDDRERGAAADDSGGGTRRSARGDAAQARVRADAWEAEAILEQRAGGSNRYLVRWAGYHPSWERWRGGAASRATR